MELVLSSVFLFIHQVDRHLRKLDQELAKFKMELEADNAGITEILERRKSATGCTILKRQPWCLTSCLLPPQGL